MIKSEYLETKSFSIKTIYCRYKKISIKIIMAGSIKPFMQNKKVHAYTISNPYI